MRSANHDFSSKPRRRAIGVCFFGVLAVGCAAPDSSPNASDARVDQPVALGMCRKKCRDDGGVTPEPLPFSLTHGPVLGAIADDSIKVWVRGDRWAQYSVRLRRADSSDSEETCSDPVDLSEDNDLVGVASLAGLEPQAAYTYSIDAFDPSYPDCAYAVTEVRSFRTLPSRGKPARIRFVAAADVAGPHIPGFTDMFETSPDFVIMLGDNVYADGPSPTFEAYRERYQAVWGGDQFTELFSQVPVFMIWDDHEIMENYWRGKQPTRSIAAMLALIFQSHGRPVSSSKHSSRLSGRFTRVVPYAILSSAFFEPRRNTRCKRCWSASRTR